MTSAFVRAAAFSLLALAAAAHAAPYPADVEAVYAARFTDISTSGRGELSRYDPLEPIIGAAPRPLPAAPASAPSPMATTANGWSARNAAR